MTRRSFVGAAGTALVCKAAQEVPVPVPIHRVMNSRARWNSQQLHNFSSNIWPEAVRDFQRCGIALRVNEETGEVRRSPGGRPVFTMLNRSAINLVVTDTIPIHWDSGRALKGVATIFEGYHLCLIALRYAHGHRIPLLSVNTCVHELLHVLMQDIYVNRPTRFQSEERELRIDWYATRLWLFGDGGDIRTSAEAYLQKLKASSSAL